MNPEQLIIDEITFYRHPIYQNYYSDINGHIYSSLTNKTLRDRYTRNGYCEPQLRHEGKSIIYMKHRFVYECFHGIIPEGLEIDHINRIRDDNRLSNLRVVKRRTNHYNRTNSKSIIVDSLPDDAIEITEYNSHHFENYFYSPSQNHIYWKNDDADEIVQLHARRANSVYVRDIDYHPREITINRVRQQLMG